MTAAGMEQTEREREMCMCVSLSLCVFAAGASEGIRDEDKETKSTHHQNNRALRRRNSCSEGGPGAGEVYGSGGGKES